MMMFGRLMATRGTPPAWAAGARATARHLCASTVRLESKRPAPPVHTETKEPATGTHGDFIRPRVIDGQLLARTDKPIAEAHTPLSVREAGVDQAPNEAATWSPSQRPKAEAMIGPRFEQTYMPTQPDSLSAMELIANVPIHQTDRRVVWCDGGDGALGHPKVYINLDKPGPQSCGYCGLRYEKINEHHH
ncbi:hypothetical protein MSPP1_002652 [Malassezia sp. CBS 17886]|nr:hypothetical protein MSPP1_002652 [Malassezia sp. CBS 17886]